jgi:hypothetical protein
LGTALDVSFAAAIRGGAPAAAASGLCFAGRANSATHVAAPTPLAAKRLISMIRKKLPITSSMTVENNDEPGQPHSRATARDASLLRRSMLVGFDG